MVDNFNGSGQLNLHTPDIYPAGSSWAIINGTFADLSGSYLAKNGVTNLTRAVINITDDDYVIEFKAKYTAINNMEHSGIMFRSNAAGNDYYRIGMIREDVRGTAVIACTYPGGVLFQPSAMGGPDKHDFVGVTGTDYIWRLVVSGTYCWVTDASDTVYLYHTALAKAGQNYAGPYNHHTTINGSWDYIKVYEIPATQITTFSIMGDSISDNYNDWPGVLAPNLGIFKPLTHAVPGSSVAASMDAQTNLCETDNASFTISALGTNDIADITAEYQENLIELYGTIGKPIYCCEVFPKDPVGSRALRNAEMATAVANAQAAGVNVTLWDTDGWFDPTPGVDTSDGLHPNASGHLKIATEMLARLP